MSAGHCKGWFARVAGGLGLPRGLEASSAFLERTAPDLVVEP